jgi:XTP/dITP diphosphohydrolase
MPGVLSARWSGAGDKANNELLLTQLADVPDERRGAAFVAATALVWSGGEVVETGRMPGRILHFEQGDGGFGYDPLFAADGNDASNAELTPEEKDAISHRGQALRALAPHIVTALGG